MPGRNRERQSLIKSLADRECGTAHGHPFMLVRAVYYDHNGPANFWKCKQHQLQTQCLNGLAQMPQRLQVPIAAVMDEHSALKSATITRHLFLCKSDAVDALIGVTVLL